MLAMLIPGFLLLKLFPRCFGYLIDLDPVKNVIITFTISYGIGLIYHKVIEWLYSIIGFRNNKEWIKKSAKKFYYKYRKDGGNTQNSNLPDNLHEYYKAYYALMKENMLNNIPILEAQVAFIRNMLPLMVMYIIITLYRCGNNLCSINLCFVTIILLTIGIILVIKHTEVQNEIYYLVPLSVVYIIVLVLCCCCNNCCINSCLAAIILLPIGAILLIKIQKKIYELVWEGDEYRKKLQNESKKKSQNES
jgi:hypothetical protein